MSFSVFLFKMNKEILLKFLVILNEDLVLG